MTNLLHINNTTNKVENISTDERTVSEIIIEGYTILDQAITPAKSWSWNKETLDWEQIDSLGRIGDDWDGTTLTNPKPEYTPE